MDIDTQATSRRRFQVPTISTPLIGRTDEIRRLDLLLTQPDVRLVTLTGTGGAGKTRLALHLSELWVGRGDLNVGFVSLDALGDPMLVVPALAGVVGVSPSGDHAMEHALQATLRDTTWLLVLDSFEHVLDAAPALAALLASCPSLTLLVTSRSRLRLREEHVMPVPPLSLAMGPNQADGASAAVELFVARAQAADPAFTPTIASVRIIAGICQRLDGLPLAIELVAPRVRHLSVTELLERLDRRLPLLTGGARDQPSRLQTMRNAIAWSYDLLPAAEQVLFQRVAVFSDGFSATAAERIAFHPSAGEPMTTTLDGLAALVDASLLQAEPGPAGTTRYRQLETIREFALDQLTASGEGMMARQAHATWCLDFAEEYALASLHPTGDEALARLEAEHANLRAALTWFDKQGDTEQLLALATALGRFWSENGHYEEGHRWIDLALARAPADAPLRARAEVALGLIDIYRGAFPSASDHLQATLSQAEAGPDPWTAGLAHIGLGGLATMAGDDATGVLHLTEVVSCADHVTDPRLQKVLRGWAHCNLGILARERNGFDDAEEHLQAAYDHLLSAGYTTGTIMALSDLGDLARDRLDYTRALALYGETLRRGRAQAGTRVVGETIEGVGFVAVAVGEVARGIRLLGAASALRERLGLRYRVGRNEQDLIRAEEIGRATLGAERQAEIWAEGRRLSADQALLLASEPIAIAVPSQLAASLTQREREILHLLATGQSDAVIAEALFLSVRTVENHVAHIRAKLGVSSRLDAARVAGLAPMAHRANEYTSPEN